MSLNYTKLVAEKAAWVNVLIGEKVASESESLDQETTEMVKHCRFIDGIQFNVWDSPSLVPRPLPLREGGAWGRG